MWGFYMSSSELSADKNNRCLAELVAQWRTDVQDGTATFNDATRAYGLSNKSASQLSPGMAVQGKCEELCGAAFRANGQRVEFMGTCCLAPLVQATIIPQPEATPEVVAETPTPQGC
jgi:hypothetical protein